ncbi:MAG: hypothetical protein CL609_15500 [Anaerolineaceae bacterium]|nr:hypothetical protein [Anaerolineaceae bacterium]
MKRFSSYFAISSGLILIFGSIGFLLFSLFHAEPAPAALPMQLAGNSLYRHSTGPQAASEIERLHGNQFPIISAASGIYGSESQINLWVSGFSNEKKAAIILNSMKKQIGIGKSPFTPVNERKEGKRFIYEVEGMGKKHFYFQSKNLVIWLAVGEPMAEQALTQTLSFFP